MTIQTDPTLSQSAFALHQLDAALALYRGELSVTVSELLGCDYIFIQHPAKTLLVHERHLAQTLNQLVEVLRLPPRQKVFVGVHEDTECRLWFHRFTCERQTSTATKVLREPITNNDQYEFMNLMFNCSSPYTPPDR